MSGVLNSFVVSKFPYNITIKTLQQSLRFAYVSQVLACDRYSMCPWYELMATLRQKEVASLNFLINKSIVAWLSLPCRHKYTFGDVRTFSETMWNRSDGPGFTSGCIRLRRAYVLLPVWIRISSEFPNISTSIESDTGSGNWNWRWSFIILNIYQIHLPPPYGNGTLCVTLRQTLRMPCELQEKAYHGSEF